MDFSKTTVFVVPSGNSLPTTGSTQDLATNQFGIFRANYTPATAANIAAEKYVYLAQKQEFLAPGQGTKRSDKIDKTKIIEWYKVVAESDLLPQVTEVSGFKIQCGETITLTVRAHSNYIEQAYFNGMTKSATVVAPCCDCGSNPCADLDPQATVDALIEKIKLTELNKFLSFERVGSGANSILRITGKPLASYKLPSDVSAFPYEFDRLWFRAFVYPGAETSQDYLTVDKCDLAASVVVKQRASYLRGTSDEIKQLEKNYFSYLASFKHLFIKEGFNPEFKSQVVDGTFYDTYVIKAAEIDMKLEYGMKVPEDFTVIVAFPTGDGTNFETAMTAFIGAPANQSASDRTTTTTTSTTTTSTTSTTVLNP